MLKTHHIENSTTEAAAMSSSTVIYVNTDFRENIRVAILEKRKIMDLLI